MCDDNPFKLKDSKLIYHNPWIKVTEDLVERPGGKDGVFGIVEMKDGVTVVALDIESNIYLVEEYKYGLDGHSLECMSGGIDNGENVQDAAKRELKEEVGAESTDWVSLGAIYPFTGIIKSRNHMYLARGVQVTAPQSTDEGEVIKVQKMPFEEAYKKVQNGEIIHGASVAAILKTRLLLKP